MSCCGADLECLIYCPWKYVQDVEHIVTITVYLDLVASSSALTCTECTMFTLIEEGLITKMLKKILVY